MRQMGQLDWINYQLEAEWEGGGGERVKWRPRLLLGVRWEDVGEF